MSPEEAMCPRCARPSPIGAPGGDCPFCQQALAVPASPPPVVLHAGKTNWPLFFIILLIPAVGDFISAAVHSIFFPILLTLVGCLCSGIVCSRMIMVRLTSVGPKRQLQSMLVTLGLFSLVFFLSFLGCATAVGIYNGH